MYILSLRLYAEGQENLVTRFIMGIIGVTIWVVKVRPYLLSPPDPPSILGKLA